MPSYMKEHVGLKEHPEHEKFMELVRKGCPKCGERLYQKGGFPIGLVHCDNIYDCDYEFEYLDGAWKLGENGMPGRLNERFRSYEQTDAYRAEKRRLKEKATDDYNRRKRSYQW